MFTSNFINSYSKYLYEENFDQEKIDTELNNNPEKGLFFINQEFVSSHPDNPDSSAQIGINVLSFVDNEKKLRHFRIDSDKIRELSIKEQSKEKTKESYNNINDILNHYKLDHVFRQKEYLLKQQQNYIKKINELADYFYDHNFDFRSKVVNVYFDVSNIRIDPETLLGQNAFLQMAARIIKKSPLFLSLTLSNFLSFFKINQNSEIGKNLTIKIVKLMAREGCNISHYIKNYGIEANTPNGQKTLIEIAQLAAINGKEISKHIKNYKINPTSQEGQKALIEIATKANLQNCENLLFLHNFNLPDDIAKQIMILALSSAKDENVQLLVDQLNDDTHIDSRSYIYSLMNTFPPHIQNLLLREKLSIPPQEVLQELSATSENPSLQGFLKYANKAYEKLENKEKVSPQTKQRLQERLVRFIGLTFLRASVLEEQGQELNPVQAKLLKRIVDVQDPALRHQMIFHILNNPCQENIYETILTLPREAQLTAFLLVCINPLNPINLHNRQHLEAQLRVLNQKPPKKIPLLRDAHFQKTILKGLLALLEDQTIVSEQKETFMRLLTQNADKDSLKRAFQSLKGLIDMNAQGRIQEWLSLEERTQSLYDFLNTQYLNVFQELILLPNEFCQMDKIENFLERLRDPSLIFRYTTNLKKLDELESAPLFKLLSKAIEAQMTERSSQYRYEYEEGTHLSHLFKDNKELQNRWMEPLKEDLSTLLSSSSAQRSAGQISPTHSTSQSIDFASHIQSSFDNGHAQAAHYPKLMTYLEKKTGLEIKTEPIPVVIHAQTAQTLSQDQEKMENFQDALIELCESASAQNLEASIKILKNALSSYFSLKDHPHPAYTRQFHEDLKAWERSLRELVKSQSTSSDETLEVIENDDFFDLMACGTEVAGSCQHVDGDPALNKCLPAYVVDGKNRIVAIRDKETKVIKARAILRLLIDQTTKQPVLFMEEIYPAIVKPEWKEGLILMAQKKVRKLNKAAHPPLLPIPLLSQALGKQENGKRYPNPIESLGSPAPFEYVDAKSGTQPNGIFTIEESYTF